MAHKKISEKNHDSWIMFVRFNQKLHNLHNMTRTQQYKQDILKKES